MGPTFFRGAVSLACVIIGLSLCNRAMQYWDATHALNENILVTGFTAVLMLCFAYFSFRSMWRGNGNVRPDVQININQRRDWWR